MGRVYNPDLKTVVVAKGTESDPLVLEAIVRKNKDGSLFFSWTGGGNAEPRVENVIKCKKSYDNGKTWSEEKILFAHPGKGMFMPAVYSDGNRLLAFPNSYYGWESTGFCQDMQSYISVSEDGGESFSIPKGIPTRINAVHIKNTIKVQDRLIFPCSWIEQTGEYWASFFGQNKPCVVDGKVYERFDGSFYSNHTEYCGTLLSDDGGKTFRLCGRIGAEGRFFVEPVAVELSDGSLVMLLRTGEKRLYKSLSYDKGESWSEPVPTDIPSPITKVMLHKDGDGAIYLLHNPSVEKRSPLSVWVSRDDMQSWAVKVVLVSDEDEPLCYPDGFIDEERGVLCISWDDRKSVYYSEFPLSKLK